MATAQDVIRVAEGEMGKSDGAKYFNELGEAYLGAWCVAFVRWCMWKAGAGFDWPYWVAWDYTDAIDPVNPQDLQPGDALSFDWDDDRGGDHVGIVKSVHDWGCVTIEGNTDWGHVAEKQRVWSVIVCGLRPRLSGGTARWIADGDRWWYRHADGSFTRNGWEKIDGRWYHFDPEGWMQVGWLQDEGKWYWLEDGKGSTEGQMAESTCVMIGGCWYAFGKTGAMLTKVQTNERHDGTYGRLVL